MYNMDPHKIKQWFPDLRRWQQLKRFFKVSDPNTDGEHLDDKAWRVRDLWDYFISACKANYWPHCEVSLDEAIKNSKVAALLSSISKINLSAGALKFLLCAVPTLRTCGMQIFTLEKKSEDEAEAKKEQSVTKAAVKSIVQPLQGKNHRLFMDNYYTSTSFWCSANSCKIPLCKEKRYCFVKYHEQGLNNDI